MASFKSLGCPSWLCLIQIQTTYSPWAFSLPLVKRLFSRSHQETSLSAFLYRIWLTNPKSSLAKGDGIDITGLKTDHDLFPEVWGERHDCCPTHMGIKSKLHEQEQNGR